MLGGRSGRQRAAASAARGLGSSTSASGGRSLRSVWRGIGSAPVPAAVVLWPQRPAPAGGIAVKATAWVWSLEGHQWAVQRAVRQRVVVGRAPPAAREWSTTKLAHDHS